MGRATRAVFFDVDFTLIYPGPMFQADGYRDFCARHGIPDLDPAAYEEAVVSASAFLDDGDDLAYDPAFFLRYIRHVIERMGGLGPNLDACAAAIYREWAACHHFQLYDDVLPTLRGLHARGLRIGLISNTHRSLVDFANHFELDQLVSASVSSSEHGYNKPHPSIFHTALKLLGVEPDAAVMVGDSYRHDIEGARAVGMEAILLRRSAPPAGPGVAVLPAYTATRVIRTLPEVLALV
ncbi:MAG TPA: HAD family hydrolase [Vicinamibacterales bacterium]|nr:HAD family hydrolase [Vicinamibacterales bacterium]